MRRYKDINIKNCPLGNEVRICVLDVTGLQSTWRNGTEFRFSKRWVVWPGENSLNFCQKCGCSKECIRQVKYLCTACVLVYVRRQWTFDNIEEYSWIYETQVNSSHNRLHKSILSVHNFCHVYIFYVTANYADDVNVMGGSVHAINPYPTAFPYGNGMVLHFYQQQESSTTKTVHKVINKGLKAYV